jgi:hypothetical protein
MRAVAGTFILGVLAIIGVFIALYLVILWWQFDTWFTALIGMDYGPIMGDPDSGTMGITRTILAVLLILLAGGAACEVGK